MGPWYPNWGPKLGVAGGNSMGLREWGGTGFGQEAI
jgi:hypothetical protein